jgi:hypothetical protein
MRGLPGVFLLAAGDEAVGCGNDEITVEPHDPMRDPPIPVASLETVLITKPQDPHSFRPVFVSANDVRCCVRRVDMGDVTGDVDEWHAEMVEPHPETIGLQGVDEIDGLPRERHVLRNCILVEAGANERVVVTIDTMAVASKDAADLEVRFELFGRHCLPMGQAGAKEPEWLVAYRA